MCSSDLRQFHRGHRPGVIIGLYLVLYSIARFIIEFFREHEQSLVGPFSITQWIALALLVLGAGILLRGRKAVAMRPENAHGMRA